MSYDDLRNSLKKLSGLKPAVDISRLQKNSFKPPLPLIDVPTVKPIRIIDPLIDELKTMNAKAEQQIEHQKEQIEHQKSEIERLDNLNRHAAEQLELLKSNFEEEKKERIKTSKISNRALVISVLTLAVNAIALVCMVLL